MTDEEVGNSSPIRHRRAASRPANRRQARDVRGALAWSAVPALDRLAAAVSLGIFVLNDTQSRAIHLAFAVFLGYSPTPLQALAARVRVPLLDWVFGAVGAFCAAYLFILLP
jgi:TRAP-type uncharacterized transport system fused permease subunit